MKFIKFLSLITIITCAPALYSMEDNTLQEQSRVPKLVDLCRQKRIEQINPIINQQYAKPNTYKKAVELLNNMNNQFQIATLNLADELYKSNEIFQHCIDLIINEIWNQCQDVTGATLDAIMHEILQNIFNRIPKELLSFIEAHFCKQKGWHVPYCLKEFTNVTSIDFSSEKLVLLRYSGGTSIDAKTWEVTKDWAYDFNFSQDSPIVFQFDRRELIDTKSGAVLKGFNNLLLANFSPNSSLMFVRYRNGRGELLSTGNFEQIIFKCALRNTLQMYKKQQSDEIKQGLTNLLNHRILTTLPEKARDILSKEITDALQDKDDTGFDALVT